jgi:hypothetical protein
MSLKRFFLPLYKYCGLSFLSRLATRRVLRILCYHGVALSDESRFRPKLFIKLETLLSTYKYFGDLVEKRLSRYDLCDIILLHEADSDFPVGRAVHFLENTSGEVAYGFLLSERTLE